MNLRGSGARHQELAGRHLPRRVALLATQGSNDTIRVKSRQHRGVESSGRRISPVAATVPPLLRCPVAVLASLVGNR